MKKKLQLLPNEDGILKAIKNINIKNYTFLSSYKDVYLSFNFYSGKVQGYVSNNELLNLPKKYRYGFIVGISGIEYNNLNLAVYDTIKAFKLSRIDDLYNVIEEYLYYLNNGDWGKQIVYNQYRTKSVYSATNNYFSIERAQCLRDEEYRVYEINYLNYFLQNKPYWTDKSNIREGGIYTKKDIVEEIKKDKVFSKLFENLL